MYQQKLLSLFNVNLSILVRVRLSNTPTIMNIKRTIKGLLKDSEKKEKKNFFVARKKVPFLFVLHIVCDIVVSFLNLQYI